MVDVISVGCALLSVIEKAIELAEQRNQNTSILAELQKFYQDLNVNVRQVQEKALCNNSAKWALDALQKDLEYALVEANTILKEGFLRSFWNANRTQSRVQELRERVMTSFQTRLSIASLDVALESKHDQDAFRAAMLKVNKELQEMYVNTSASIKQEQQLALRRELGEVVKTIMSAMGSQSIKIDAAVSMISSIQPQTSDAEKFRGDVLAALNGLSARDAAASRNAGRASTGGASSSAGLKWFQDPVTWETMCDPVKATDGHTYNRWTIVEEPNIHPGLDKSPFTPDDPRPFCIAADDLDVRSRLFHKFPAYGDECQKRRAKYKETALQKVQLKHFGDAAMMLQHVLEWAPHDVDCTERLEYVRSIISDDNDATDDSDDNDAADDSDATEWMSADDNDVADDSDATEWESEENLHGFGSSIVVAGQNISLQELPDITSMMSESFEMVDWRSVGCELLSVIAEVIEGAKQRNKNSLLDELQKLYQDLLGIIRQSEEICLGIFFSNRGKRAIDNLLKEHLRHALLEINKILKKGQIKEVQEIRGQAKFDSFS